MQTIEGASGAVPQIGAHPVKNPGGRRDHATRPPERAKRDGDPGAIRTRDFQLRRLALYPAELPGHDRQRTPTT